MKKSISKILWLGCILFLWGLGQGQRISAQPFSNSWINFNNTYYKFKIAQEGIYRITKAELDAIGMSTITGNKFAIFREGQEIPIYTSTAGVFGSNDFIELYATKANGKIDKPLYPDPYFQPNDDVNLISDTAYYFLTYDNGVHQRMQMVTNPIPVPAPTPSSYCWVKSYPLQDIRTNAAAPGQSHNLNPEYGYFYSSDYDLGEGPSYTIRTVNAGLSVPTPKAYAGGPAASLSITVATNDITATQHHPYVKLGTTTVFDTVINTKFKMVKRTVSIPNSLLLATNTIVRFTDGYKFYVEQGSIQYPRTYDFSGNFSSKATFQLPQGDRYIEISNFTTGGQAPIFYDLTNNKIYQGTESAGNIKCYLDASIAKRDMLLTNAASINTITDITPVQFRNYTNAANQGNYIILTHKDYITASPNYIEEYKAYRSTATGGGFQPVVVDVSELYDQFGYGYELHPISIKNFIDYANNTWTVKPGFLFIIGKGITYRDYTAYRQSTSLYPYPLVPTWGHPGADNLFSSFNDSQKPILATGRLSAWNNQQIGDYLVKVKAYEEAIKPLSVPTVAHEFWKKKVLHIAGGNNLSQQNMLAGTLNLCEAIIEDTLIGGIVTTIRKSSTDPVEQVNNYLIDSFMNQGVGYVSFYGHGSSSGFDFNLNSPDNYNSKPRYPVFGAYACEVAHIFALATDQTISEKYINSATGGSIVMIAGNNTGWTSNLPDYMTNLYKSFSYRQYGKTLGEQYQKNIEYIQSTPQYAGDFMDIHTQSLLFQGDPGISLYNPEKVDFAIEETSLSSIPTNVTTELDSFDVKVIPYSLGKTTRDSVWVRLQHTRPGVGTVLFADSIHIANLLNVDTIKFRVPLDPNKDIGLNNYTVKIDAGEQFEELSENNNQANLQLFIYSENLVPVYPKEFAIVHQQGITLKASTLNAFAPLKKYRFEIDTTENYNSTLKQSIEIASSGGIVKWKPVLTYKDSVVYYWRTAPDSLINGSYSWSGSSFIYLANGSDGWNQSHYFQYKKDEPYSGIELLAANRKFAFKPVTNIFKVEDKVISPPTNDYNNVRQSLNDVVFDIWGCQYSGSVQIVVIDPITGIPWKNTIAGIGGSSAYCGVEPNPVRMMFEFATKTEASRNNARKFIDSIPVGNYVMIKNLIYGAAAGSTAWDQKAINEWKADTAVNGSGISLYHSIRNLGFDQIDSFTSKRVFAFFGRKGVDTFVPTQRISAGINDKIEFEVPFFSYPDTGTVQSQLVGPALEWKSLKWRTSSTDNAPQNDSAFVRVYGVDTLDQQTLLYSGFARDTSLSFIPAKKYPNLKLNWYSVDNITRTSPYLDYWRVLYAPVPEAALNAAALFEFKDSLGEGQKGKLRIAIENLTPVPMDSMLVSTKVIDANGVKHVLSDKRYKKLTGNDTLIADIDFDVSAYHGSNFIFVEANPNNDQPEQYHPNNLGYLSLFVQADKLNPLLDVTFDGIHILDKDIVSSKPLIKVLMRDENKYLALNDTTLMKVQLLYPNQSTAVDVPMDGTICKFIPAQIVNGQKNEARVEYKPTLPEDGVYKLIVSGRDKAGNTAGNTLNYEVNFTVENKPSITNVLNYPNPFSTATQFIFTMTGSEIPSQFKIQILTVTGKVVREIKKYELGDLHIGRNMTEYRWDGKDEYGQMLGNGVYLYRVITSIRGTEVEQRKNTAVDKHFKNGYGKLYIMR